MSIMLIQGRAMKANNLLPECFQEIDLSPKEKLYLLQECEWSRFLDSISLSQLASYLGYYKIPGKQRIFSEGDTYAFMCLILQGKVEIVKELAEAREGKSGSQSGRQIIAELESGTTVGEMTLIDGEPRSATAMTCTSCECFVLTEASMQLIRNDYPKLWGTVIIRIIKLITGRLRDTSFLLQGHIRNAHNKSGASSGARAIHSRQRDLHVEAEKKAPKVTEITDSKAGNYSVKLPSALLEQIERRAREGGIGSNEMLIKLINIGLVDIANKP